MDRKSIKDIIYSAYVRAALVPILVIELTLLIMYFAITGYIDAQTEQVMLEEAKLNIGEIAVRESRSINQQISEISDLAVIAQKENQRLFAHPADFASPNGQPEFTFAPNGSYYKVENNGGSALWYSGIVPIGPAEQRKALITEGMDPVFKVIFESNPNNVGIYFNSFDSMNRYYPFIPDIDKVYEPRMDIPKFNFYYLADQTHNPSKKPVWTEVYLDPAGKGWMTSCIVPIYNPSGKLEGVTGIDITIDRFVTNILNLKLPWKGSAFLVDQSGVILAMPSEIETVLGIKELRQQVYTGHVKQDTVKPEAFNLLKNKDPEIAKQIQTAFHSKELSVMDFHVKSKGYYLAQSVIGETGWKMMILVDKDIVLEPAMKLSALSKRVGIMALFMMILFYILFFTYLMVKSKKTAGRIARPIIQLADRTSGIREKLFKGDLHGLEFYKKNANGDELGEIEEIHLLLDNFAVLSDDLRELYLDLEEKVRQRTRELEIANLQILQQDKMASIGQLAAGIAHEINNPMGYVISNIGVLDQYHRNLLTYIETLEACLRSLKEGDLGDEIIRTKAKLNIEFIAGELADLIEETLDGTNRVKVIVEELRNFSRLEIEAELGDINRGIDSVINIVWNELKYKVDLKREYGELPEIPCNMGKLSQVFMNLLLNAVQAIEEHGEITIKTWLEENQIKIAISDTGMGIPENIQKRIFEPFYTTKPVGSGTGLGLSISYDIVKKHGGSIEVVSRVGEGTTFIICLPVVESYSDNKV